MKKKRTRRDATTMTASEARAELERLVSPPMLSKDEFYIESLIDRLRILEWNAK